MFSNEASKILNKKIYIYKIPSCIRIYHNECILVYVIYTIFPACNVVYYSTLMFLKKRKYFIFIRDFLNVFELVYDYEGFV